MSAAPAVTEADLQRLIALGRRTGDLTPADLQANLPIDAMTPEAIAQVVLDLDAAGITVDLDDLLAGPIRPGGTGPVPPAPESAPGPARLAGASARPRAVPAAPAAATAINEAEPPAAVPPGDRGRVRRAVLVAGLIVLALMGIVLLALGR